MIPNIENVEIQIHNNIELSNGFSLGDYMFRKFTIALMLFSLFLLPQYAQSTKLKSSWKNPAATPASLQFEKVLVVALIPQEFTRKVAEDKVVKILKAGDTSPNAIPSYMILGAPELKDPSSAKSKITEMGFDGVCFEICRI